MTRHIYQRRPVESGAIPTVIFFLLIANGLVFALQQVHPGYGGLVTLFFALWPLDSMPPVSFYPWQLVTYGFLHGNLTHLVFNMFMLWMFGREIELLMGTRRFLIYFVTCVVGAGVVQLIVAALMGNPNPTVGASGGVFGLLLAFGMAFPNRMILLLIPPIPMKAKYLVILAGAAELYFGISGGQPGIANFAHLGGMVFGYILIRHWQKSRPRY